MRHSAPISLKDLSSSSCPSTPRPKRLLSLTAFVWDQVKLSAFAVCVFLAIPVAGLVVLAVLALGLFAVAGMVWGLLSAAGWWFFGDANAGRSALVGLGSGAGAFVALVLLWGRVFALLAWLRRGGRCQDAEFNS